MATIPYRRVGAKAEIGSADLPEQVTDALAALAGAVKEGLLALSAGRVALHSGAPSYPLLAPSPAPRWYSLPSEPVLQQPHGLAWRSCHSAESSPATWIAAPH